jgi:glycosyltransferase involved in cell wall biosynthesis
MTQRPRSGPLVTDSDRILAVVIPAYNEAASIGEVLRRVDAFACVREIVVVDDGSTDDTASIVESFLRLGCG